MDNIVRLKKQDINNFNIPGNFLYIENGEILFLNSYNHMLFENNKLSLNGVEVNFQDYIHNFLGVCAKVNNCPSLLFLNCVPKNSIEILNKDKRNYTFLTGLENDKDYKIFNSNPSITCVQNGIINCLKTLVETRSGIELKNDVFVFFNEPELYSNLNEFPGIETIISVCKSRRIYFVFNFVDSKKFIQIYGKDSYELIESYCPVKFNVYKSYK